MTLALLFLLAAQPTRASRVDVLVLPHS